MSQQTAQLPHEQKVLIFVTGLLDQVVNRGELQFVDTAGNPSTTGLLTGHGQDIFLDLVREGFLPTDREIEMAIFALRHEGKI